MGCSYVKIPLKEILVILVLILPPANARTFFLSTTGSDKNNGSINSPWYTVLHAWQNSGGGDTILVREGTYTEHEMWLNANRRGNGAKNEFWTLKAFTGENAIFTNARIIIDESYVRIQGLIFRGEIGGNSFVQAVSWGGIHEYIEIVDNHFEGFQTYPPLYFIGNNSIIQGNIVDITDSESHGIYIMHGSNNIIRNNYITGMAKYGLHVYDEDKYPKEPPPVIKNLLIENNVVSGSLSRSGIIISSGADPPGGIPIMDVVVRNNVVTYNSEFGITLRYGGTNKNIAIYNNTFYKNKSGIFIDGDIADSIIVMNNIFCSNSSGNINAINVNSLKVSHNLYWQPSSIGSGAIDNNAVDADPLFVDALTGDFHLREGSLAIDAGTEVGIPYSGVAPDIGAFEYDQALSVKLLSFEACLKDNAIELNWITLSASDNLGFDIERSYKRESFTKIGFIEGNGNINIQQRYRFLDKNIKEGNYRYRLKLLNSCGSDEYSHTISIIVKFPNRFNLQQNYPNPFNPYTEICYSLPYSNDIDLSIFDIAGRKIISLVLEKQAAGQKIIKWDGKDKNNVRVSSGTYFCRLKAGEFSIVKKILLLR